GGGASAELFDEATRDRGSDQRVALDHLADRIGQLPAANVLEQEPARAALHRLVDVLVAVEGGEDEHAGGRGRATSRRVASSPSILGMRMSMSATSGSRRRASSTASAPSPASPITSRSGSRSTIAR